MSLLNCVDGEIGRYGSAVTICQDGRRVEARAFVEPLRYRNKIYIGGECRPLGALRREKYLRLDSEMLGDREIQKSAKLTTDTHVRTHRTVSSCDDEIAQATKRLEDTLKN